MDLSDVQRWQWCVVGAILGMGLGYAWSNVEPTRQPRSMAPQVFEVEIRKSEFKPGVPWVANISVQPRVNDIYPVYFDIVSQGEKGAVYERRWTAAEVPFKPTMDADASKGDSETVLTYLQRIQKKYPKLSYGYAWWAEPRWTMILAGLAGVVVVGGIWPTIVSLLVGAGLGPAPKPKQEYDLSRFGKGKKPKLEPSSFAAAASRTAPTEDDLDKLEAMEAQLARNVGDMHVTAGTAAPGATPGGGQSGAIKQLDQKPLEVVVDEKPEEEKDYKGDFYPTAVGSPHKPPAPPPGH